jgi:hypothetical protein
VGRQSPGWSPAFSKSSAQHVDLADLVGASVTEARADLLLYQAYLGRFDAAGGTVEVFVNDGTGPAGSRTWFDGIGYAAVPEPASLILPAAAAAMVLRRTRRVRRGSPRGARRVRS